MKVLCAWCEKEGKETLIGEISLYDREVTSHGICKDHQQVLFMQIRELKWKQNPRLRRPRRLRMKPRISGSPTLPNCVTPWRRRHTGRTSLAQLSLPFGDAETVPAPAHHEVQLSAFVDST
jgi:hypothetical protein